MSVDAKFVNAPFQLNQFTGARGRFPQYLMEIMRDLPDPRAIAAGSRLLTGSDSRVASASHGILASRTSLDHVRTYYKNCRSGDREWRPFWFFLFPRLRADSS